MKRLSVCLIWTFLGVTAAAADDIGFIEDFALAKDRSASLRKLIPGTEDYYYYHALHYLNTEQYEKAEALTRPWLERFGQSQRLTEIQTRYALLTYDRQPQRTLDYLRQRLNLRFDHQQDTLGAAPNLPTALDQKLISRARLQAESLTRWNNLDNFEQSALDWLAREKLDWERRRNLLQRLERPDLADLSAMIAEDLKSPHPAEFGTMTIHRQLTLAQLNELLRLRPELLNQMAFIRIFISKLHPGADEDWRHQPALTRAYLDRLLSFVRRLNPVHNGLKAHVLYHRLVLERAGGYYDRDLFLEYLQLPRQQPYMAKALLEAELSRRYPADLNTSFTDITLLPVVGIDEPLVRSYLQHFFLAAPMPKEFEPYIDDVYLKQLFAETKIENGLGEPEQWASQLPPEVYRQFKERVDIDFAPTNQTTFATDEAVRLDLHIKNVPTLIVKVFELNAQAYYRTHQHEVDTDINLDGLIANAEDTHAYTEPAERRVQRRFEFPALKKPGVYVIDFIGSGKSSRALIRKGKLHPLVTTTNAGQVITVVDDTNKPMKNASVWLGGQEYKADADGILLVPFSTSPGRRPIVLSQGDFASLDYLEHQPESYELKAGIHVEREALLAQRKATLLVRPGLYLNGQPISTKVLEEVKLRITATDLEGIATSTEVPDFKLYDDRESTHEFRVPLRLASLNIVLEAKVKSLSQNQKLSLSDSETLALNGIEKSDKIEDLHLAKFADVFVLELLGRTGEPRPDRPVQLTIKHRDFREPVRVTLKTDDQGRVHLGPLADIVSVTVNGPEGQTHTWHLPLDHHTYRELIHARAGETITLPYLGSSVLPTREDLALFEMRGAVIQADRFERIAIRASGSEFREHAIEIRGLPPGDYDLWIKRTDERIRIRIVGGPVVDQHVLGKVRHLELPLLKPVQIASLTADAESLTIQLRDASQFARVHLFATRYEPAFSAFSDLSKVRDRELRGMYPAHAESAFVSGRNIGDEYRYILDRKLQRKFPGNQLERPQLLLNPWAIRSTETGEQAAQAGRDYDKAGAPAAAKPTAPPTSEAKPEPPSVTGFSNLDFLADAAAVLVNLKPDKDGVIKLSRKDIGNHSMIRVVAVDPVSTTSRAITLPPTDTKFLDLRLHAGLDPKNHFTQQKQVSILTAGRPFVLADAASSRFEAYDSLPRVYGLYVTLSQDPKVAEFAFLLTWPILKPEEKRTFYSKYASHELNFFLSKKDPEFFSTVVQPYLTNKKDKTFLDRWLLGENLNDYLQPWRYGRLNTVERILLAQRLAGEPTKTARHLEDLNRLRPPDKDRLSMLFESAVVGRALSMDYFLLEKNVNHKILRLDEAEKLRERMLGEAYRRSGRSEDQKLGIRGEKDEMLRRSLNDAEAPQAGAGATGVMSGIPQTRFGMQGAGKAEDAAEKKKRASAEGKEKAYKELSPEIAGVVVPPPSTDMPWFVPSTLDDLRRKKSVAQLYRKLDPTQEWAENNYHHLLIAQQTADLVGVSGFWLDYARHDGKSPFLSKNFADASHNFTEMMFALAVLDLPFSAEKHDVKFDGGKMTFTPAGPVIAFHEEVKPVAAANGKINILVSQNFYRHGDRFREENGEKIDKFVTEEFVVQTVYGCQVVVTNPTSSRQRLSVLIQTPVGSIPVGNAQATRTVLLDLEPYRTQTIDYLFYFPKPGHFVHFPVHVAKNELLVAAAAPFSFDVVAKPTKLDTESWAYVSQNGTTEQVIAFLNRENVNALDLDKIAFRMKDKDFFTAVVQLLRERHVYQPTLWSYGLYHGVVPEAREYLTHVDAIVGEVAGPIASPLLVVDPVARHLYEHLEYKPLVNARTHALGQRRQIVNARFHEQYHRFLKLLSYHRSLSDEDLLAETYYLLLQDRIEEALTTFTEVNPDKIATKIQYDYCTAYLDMYGEDPQKARSIAAKYANHPVDRWRNAFAAITLQLEEIEGNGTKIADAEDRQQRQTQLASKEPGFEFHLDAKKINLTWQNLDTVTVNYYLMDVELLFSRNPFVQESGGLATIRPNATRVVQLPAGQNKTAFDLPENLVRRNVLVEVTAGGKTRALPYYANAMDVRLLENYGQLRVTDAGSGKPLPKVYVKTYVRQADGQVKFHKDGYTDLRGRFDYASVSTPEKAPLNRFAILVLSEDHGAQIREAAVPQQ